MPKSDLWLNALALLCALAMIAVGFVVVDAYVFDADPYVGAP